MVIFAFLYLFSLGNLEAQEFNLESPNKKLRLNIHVDEHISFSVDHQKKRVFDVQRISMKINNGEILGSFPKLSKHKIEVFEELVTVQIPNKDAKIFSRANQISMSFKQGFQLIFRIFDDGVTYRFIRLRHTPAAPQRSASHSVAVPATGAQPPPPGTRRKQGGCRNAGTARHCARAFAVLLLRQRSACYCPGAPSPTPKGTPSPATRRFT